MIQLLAETPRDQEMIEKFQRAFDQLKKHTDDRINDLVEENKRLRREFDEYRKRHPSSVGIKNGKPYAIAPESASNNETTPPRRKPGAQIGHKGHFRARAKITERVRISAGDYTCPECSSRLVRKGMRTRIIEDIPPIIPRIIQYRIERMYCRRCGKIFEPDIPEALPNARLSLRTMLIAAYLKIAMRMSLENVSATMKEVFRLQVSEGEVQDILYLLSEALGPEYDRLLKRIRKAPSRHTDTTSWREGGENRDLWVFVTKAEAIFHIARSNGHEVAENLLGKHLGTDIHDRFKAFDTLAKKTHNQQQYCWSHIICDAKELEKFYGEEGAGVKKSLQAVYEEAKSYRGKGSADDVDKLYHKLVFLLDRDYDHRRSRKFVENLLKRKKEWLFRFVVDPEVEPTNNRAERALRPAVIYRKTSGGTRSDRGSEAFERLQSIFYTQKLRKKSILVEVPSMIRKYAHPG